MESDQTLKIKREIKRNMIEKKKGKKKINYLWVFQEDNNRWVKMYDKNSTGDEEEEEEEEVDQMRQSQMGGHLNDKVMAFLHDHQENGSE